MSVRRKDFFRCMRNLKEQIFTSKDREAGAVWMEVKDLLINTKYSNFKNAGTLGQYLLDGYNDDSISIKMGISTSTIRVHKKNLSDELYIIFGDDFFELFEDGFYPHREVIKQRVGLAKLQMQGGEDFLTNFLPIELNMKMRDSIIGVDVDTVSVTDFSLKDCNKEISFLTKYSISSIDRDLSALNKEKLAYIVGVLDSKMGTVDTRYELYKAITD